MRCHDARKQLQLYIDNQLTMNQVRELEGHIAQCGACSRELSYLEEITSSLRQLQLVDEEGGNIELRDLVHLQARIVGMADHELRLADAARRRLLARE